MFDFVIIGGGVHGTYVASQLLQQPSVEHDSVRIVDPNPMLLDSFTRKARQCGMQALRSTFVHHIATKPFSLRTYAEEHERENEIIATEDHPERPSLDLFVDHARSVVDHHELSSVHRRARVLGITDENDLLRVETDEGPLLTRRCVLAIGNGGQLSWPKWATPDDPSMWHVWQSGFDPDGLVDDQVIVVGGGITAAQVACQLATRTSVTLVSRHPLRESLIEASPRWIGWGHIGTHLHTLPAGSKKRHERVCEARNDGTVPSYVMKRLVELRDHGDLVVEQGEITDGVRDERGQTIRFRDGSTRSGVQVVLATGVESPYTHPLVQRIGVELELETGYRGMPVLDDDTLEWHRARSGRSGVFVTGLLAQGTVGPLARNIIGARRAAERIIETWLSSDRTGTATPLTGNDTQ